MLQRLEWCKKFQRTTWSKVLFTDESWFYTFPVINTQTSRFYTDDSAKVPPIQRPKHPDKVMVWGGISYYGKTKLYRLTGSVTADSYVALIQKVFKDDIPLIFDKDCIWMQDGAPAHSAHKTLAELDKSDCIEAYFGGKNSWPANSPDLNPIENCWAIMKQKLSGKTYTSPDLLFEEIQEIWNSLPGRHLKRLCGSMPKRVKLCIAAQGGHIEY